MIVLKQIYADYVRQVHLTTSNLLSNITDFFIFPWYQTASSILSHVLFHFAEVALLNWYRRPAYTENMVSSQNQPFSFFRLRKPPLTRPATCTIRNEDRFPFHASLTITSSTNTASSNTPDKKKS